MESLARSWIVVVGISSDGRSISMKGMHVGVGGATYPTNLLCRLLCIDYFTAPTRVILLEVFYGLSFFVFEDYIQRVLNIFFS